MKHILATVCPLVLCTAQAAAAQCPNGTPPPCAGAPRRAPPVVPDPARIAILPFRVTTADSLLGEGVAELLSEEFTGEGNLRAAHMGSALRAWRRAGGAARSPLAQAEEIRVASGLGAGLLVDGSIVGLGQRLTLSASVIAVPSGAIRRTSPVSGPADSLPALVERLAAGLLEAASGAAAGTASRGAIVRMTDSPAAMRLYIEGMALFRRGRFFDAADAFEHAYAADTLFARAALMRSLTAAWGPGFGTGAGGMWAARARNIQHRLSERDRRVLTAMGGNLATRERVVAQAPESPEAWYFLGDALYHGARSRGWTETIARAREAFERSLELDSQATSLQHLIEIGLWTADTALLRAAWPAYDRLREGDAIGLGIVVASRIGDRRMLDAVMRREARPDPTTFIYTVFSLSFLAVPAGTPASVLDQAYDRLTRSTPSGLLPLLRFTQFQGAMVQGRPSVAARTAAAGPVTDTAFTSGFAPDLWFATAAALGDGDPGLGAAAALRLRAITRQDSAGARARCAVRLWDALVGDSIVQGDDAMMRAHGQLACAEVLDAMSAQRAGTLDSGRLAVADSIARGVSSVLFANSGVGPTLLSRIHEARGNRRRALALLRNASTGFPDWLMAVRRRNEARLSLLDGDTANAIRVYREYLDLRRDAEPVLAPQRDSVQAELNRLLPWRPRGVP